MGSCSFRVTFVSCSESLQCKPMPSWPKIEAEREAQREVQSEDNADAQLVTFTTQLTQLEQEMAQNEAIMAQQESIMAAFEAQMNKIKAQNMIAKIKAQMGQREFRIQQLLERTQEAAH